MGEPENLSREKLDVVSRKPRRHRSPGQLVADATSEMMGWTMDEIDAAANAWPSVNPQYSWAQIAAARWLLRAASDAVTSNGTPVAERCLQNLMDRTMGKPTQTVDVNQTKTEVRVLALVDAHLDDLKDAIHGRDHEPISILNSHALLEADPE